jgi:hypothetical protein
VSKQESIRCRYSKKGQKTFRLRNINIEGYYLGPVLKPKYGKDIVRVLWDGHKTTNTLHKSFIELIKATP